MPLDYEKKGHVAYFTIRNGSVNPMTPALHKQMYHTMLDFLSDEDVRVGIMTGAGDRAFSAGDDIKTQYTSYQNAGEEMSAHLWSRHRVEEEPHLVELHRVVDLEGRDPGAALGFDDHQALAGEAHEGLAQRRGRHPPLLGEVLGSQPLARRELPVEDGPAQLRVDPLRTGGGHLGGRRHARRLPPLTSLNNL